MTEFTALIGRASTIVSRLLSFVLLLAVAMAALRWFGVRVPVTVNATELAYVAGAFWLITRGAA